MTGPDDDVEPGGIVARHTSWGIADRAINTSAHPVCRQTGCTNPPATTTPTCEGDRDLCPFHLAAVRRTRDRLNQRDSRGHRRPPAHHNDGGGAA